MEENGVEDLTPMDAVDGGHLLNKGRPEAPMESMYPQNPEAFSILGSQEMLIPVEGGNCPRELEGFLDGKTVTRSDNHVDASEHPFSIPSCMDDAGVMVEELTVKNYDGSNLAIVGTSNNRGRMLTRQNQWQQLYQLGNGSGSGCSPNETPYKDTGQALSSGLEDVGYSSFPEFLAQKAITDDCGEDLEEFVNTENKVVSGNTHGAVRTKIISKSGFSEFFVKKTLKGKGIMQRGPLHSGFNVEPRNKKSPKADDGGIIVASTSLQPNFKNVTASPCMKSEPKVCSTAIDGVSLQEWIKAGHKKVNKLERLNIFKQILELLDHAHSQGVVWHDIRPSSFKVLPLNQVKYNGAAMREEMRESSMDGDFLYLGKRLIKKRLLEQGAFPSLHETLRKKKLIQNTDYLEKLPQTNLTSGIGLEIGNSSSKLGIRGNRSKYTGLCSISSGHPTLSSEYLEENYYASPEELNRQGCTTSSNIYSLGVLFFELLGDFDFDGARVAALSDLRHRILPPNFLSENPREAGFCLWLLHPEPASRPSTRKILEYEVMILSPPASTEELSSSFDQDGTESELLLQFLASLQEQKQKRVAKLLEDNQCLEADIEEIERRHSLNKLLVRSRTDSFNEMEKGLVRRGNSCFDMVSQLSVFPNTPETRFEKNISHLETAYFSTRSKVQLPENDSTVRTDIDLLRTRENCNQAWQSEEKTRSVDYLGDFFDGFCKYSRYSKFEVRGTLRNSDFNSSSNVICSLSFDRDGDYFAAAGVSKKIKIFGFSAVFNNLVDIHYPAVEMMNKSKLSCVCWNSYIKNYLASTDYDGAVKLWDASTGQETSQYKEHERRAWSVDFSQVCPTKLASGSDDCTVKLWNINEKNSLGTIRNIANVCCVQFSAHSTHLLAFGSADYRTYCYDLRNTKAPWCILGGHGKAVSYVKFLDSETLVSASTDSTLKLWDLNRTNPCGLSTNACNLTFSGHTNEKNFVGLSVSDGYIACGSETNEVCAYYRSLPMPIASLKFGSIDPVCGKEIDDDNGQFVSSICWRGKSDMLIAANSSGCIKVLQMV